MGHDRSAPSFLEVLLFSLSGRKFCDKLWPLHTRVVLSCPRWAALQISIPLDVWGDDDIVTLTYRNTIIALVYPSPATLIALPSPFIALSTVLSRVFGYTNYSRSQRGWICLRCGQSGGYEWHPSKTLTFVIDHEAVITDSFSRFWSVVAERENPRSIQL